MKQWKHILSYLFLFLICTFHNFFDISELSTVHILQFVFAIHTEHTECKLH